MCRDVQCACVVSGFGVCCCLGAAQHKRVDEENHVQIKMLLVALYADVLYSFYYRIPFGNASSFFVCFFFLNEVKIFQN